MKLRKTNLRSRIALLGVILLMAFSPLSAQEIPDLSGRWDGRIEIPGMSLEISVHLSRDSAGLPQGTIDIPQQQAKGLPLAKLALTKDSVSFEILNIPGQPLFKGKLNSELNEIAGDFSQAGSTFPFRLSFVEEAQIAGEQARIDSSLAQLRLFVDSTLKSWKAPGAAVTIVKDNKVIMSEGFGFRSVKDSLPVTSQTIFAIGSSTKAFTTAALGILVDEGKIDWDKTVSHYYPEFKMKDEFASQKMTVRDLVTHRSGLPRHDLSWYNNNSTSRREFVGRLAYLEPNADFRTTFQYQNLMFLTAGYVAELVTGKSWEEIVKEKILDPLGMTNSNFSVLESQKSADYALPYRDEDSLVREIPFRNITAMGPAGSINSCADDMAKWMMLHLNKGKAGERQIVSEAQMAQMHTPQMAIGQSPRFPERSPICYGLGWFLEASRGHNRIYHGGNIDGFSALVSLYPFDNVGITVLVNQDASAVPSLITYRAADLLFGLEPIDWSARMKTEVDKAREEQKKAQAREPDRVKGSKPSHPLADYTGEYENPGYGTLTVKLEGKNLQVEYNGIVGALEHWHYDVFNANIKDFPAQKLLLTFNINSKGDIDRVSAPFELATPEIVFTRKPSQEMKSAAFLSQFVGEYELSGQSIKVELKGDTLLTLTITGQPTYELLPYKGYEFTLKEVTGVSVEFKPGKEGKAIEAVFKQPNGTFIAERKK
ncbi:MAG: serine hydrolase [bacterium]